MLKDTERILNDKGRKVNLQTNRFILLHAPVYKNLIFFYYVCFSSTHATVALF